MPDMAEKIPVHLGKITTEKEVVLAIALKAGEIY